MFQFDTVRMEYSPEDSSTECIYIFSIQIKRLFLTITAIGFSKEARKTMYTAIKDVTL